MCICRHKNHSHPKLWRNTPHVLVCACDIHVYIFNMYIYNIFLSYICAHTHIHIHTHTWYIHAQEDIVCCNQVYACVCVCVCECVHACAKENTCPGVCVFISLALSNSLSLSLSLNHEQQENVQYVYVWYLQIQSCRSFSTKEPLLVGFFCEKWPIKRMLVVEREENVRYVRVWYLQNQCEYVYINVCACIFVYMHQRKAGGDYAIYPCRVAKTHRMP